MDSERLTSASVFTLKRPSPTDGATPNTIWNKVLRGGAWLLLLRLVERGLGVARIAVLARLLTPNDFGLMGIVLVVTLYLFTPKLRRF